MMGDDKSAGQLAYERVCPLSMTMWNDLTGPQQECWFNIATGEYKLQALATDAEHIRVSRWHATYNAALTGMLVIVTNIGSAAQALEARRRVHAACVEAADEAHGPLVKP
jgi:hypothetical protein